MTTHRMDTPTTPTTADDNPLGSYLKERRAKLDPAAFGLPLTRRRTPGLRREEVAQRAHVSATWYTWLEQGRGGAPSADVLDRLARALALKEVEREHLYLLAQGRPPEVRPPAPFTGISPRLQRLLDSLETSPALVRNAEWDIVAWNEAAAAVLTDYAALQPEERNVMRLFFRDARVRATQPNWEHTARFVVATFRAEIARTGTSRRARGLVEELSKTSPEFAAIWRDHDVRTPGEGTKLVQPMHGGPLALEYSSFAVDGQLGLGMVVYTPTTPEDAAQVGALIARRRAAARTPGATSLPSTPATPSRRRVGSLSGFPVGSRAPSPSS